jgi:hypothetical protein
MLLNCSEESALIQPCTPPSLYVDSTKAAEETGGGRVHLRVSSTEVPTESTVQAFKGSVPLRNCEERSMRCGSDYPGYHPFLGDR